MSSERRLGRASRLAVVGAGVLWGTAGTSQAMGHISRMGFAVGAARTTVAAIALVAFALVFRRYRPGSGGSQWTAMMFLVGSGAGVMLALYQVMFFVGVAKTGVAIGTLVAVGLAPVIAGGLAVFKRHRPSLSWAITTALSIAGLAFLVFRTSSPVSAWGTVASIVAAFAYVGYTELTRRLFALGAQALEILVVIFLSGALISAPIIVLNWHQTILTVVEPVGIVTILFLGLVATFVPYLLWIHGVQTVPTTTATTLSLSEPLTGTLLGIIVLNEQFTLGRAVGAALLLAGLAVGSLAKNVYEKSD